MEALQLPLFEAPDAPVGGQTPKPLNAADVAALERRWLAKYDEWHALSVELSTARASLGQEAKGARS